MNKLLAALVASLFAVSTAFAASHAGAPMAGASGAKPMEAKKEDKAMAKDAKSDAKSDMKADKKAKKTKAKAKKDEKKA